MGSNRGGGPATRIGLVGADPWDAGPIRFSRVFDALDVMLLVPPQQGRTADYALRLMPSVPLARFIDVRELFGFGEPYDLNDLPDFPRRASLISCEEWGRRLQPGGR
jgi:8-hydroxy-5-deazaflavin:NADPH oxidoreductase